MGRPWKRKFLGYTVTTQFSPRLKPASEALKRAKDRIRQITHRGRGRNIRQVIKEINLFTRGWVGYFRLATVKHAFELLDQWIRRRPPQDVVGAMEETEDPVSKVGGHWTRPLRVRARPPQQGVVPGGLRGPRTYTRP